MYTFIELRDIKNNIYLLKILTVKIWHVLYLKNIYHIYLLIIINAQSCSLHYTIAIQNWIDFNARSLPIYMILMHIKK